MSVKFSKLPADNYATDDIHSLYGYLTMNPSANTMVIYIYTSMLRTDHLNFPYTTKLCTR